MADSPRRDRDMPPPLPGLEAAERRAQDPVPVVTDAEPRESRGIVKSLLIGLVSVIVSAAIPIVIVIILAFVAQRMIGG